MGSSRLHFWRLDDKHLGKFTEQLSERGLSTPTCSSGIKDPTGLENAKNIYFGLIMGVSAALPSCFHLFLFFSSIFKKFKKKEITGQTEDSKSPN